MIVCSDHSQSRVEAGDRPLPRVRRLRRAARPTARARAADARDRGLPELARGAGLRARPRRAGRELVPRVERTLLALEGVDLVMRMTDHPDGEAAIRGRRGDETRSCASRRAATSRTCAASAGASRATSTCSRSRVRDGRVDSAATRTRSARAWSALRCRTVGRGAGLGGARLRVPRLGRRAPRRRRLARLAARQRLARLADLVRHRARPADAREQWALRDIVPMIDDALRRRELARRCAGRSRCSRRCSPWRSHRPAQAQTAGTTVRPAGALVEPERYDRRPRGRALSAREALAIAAAVPRIRAARSASTRRPTRAPTSPSAAAGSCRGSCRRVRGEPRARGDRPGARRRPRPAACWRRGPARRSTGRWRAATRASSGARSTRRGCGSALCVAVRRCRSRARRCACCTSTWRCCWRSRSPTRSSAPRSSASRCRAPTRCSATCWCAW